MRNLLLLRPEPGLSASAKRAAELGLDVIARPLFKIEPMPWVVPDPAGYDALLLTSANAVRYARQYLGRLRRLPVFAVGATTADAARQAGLQVAHEGQGGVADLLAGIPAPLRLLHLAGEQRREADHVHAIESISVYRSVALENPELPPLAGLVAAVHSPRAAARLAELALHRDWTAIAAISTAAADACGVGWERVEAAELPNEPSLLALAATLCHTSPPE